MMDSNCYLEAMGIPLWRCKTTSPKLTPHLILVDPLRASHRDQIFSHPIVTTVLSLLELAPADCQLTVSAKTHTDYLWDMRSKIVEQDGELPMTSLIASKDIAMLERDSLEKRQLWQQLGNILDKNESDDI